MPGLEVFQSLIQQASARGSRSTALNPLQWTIAILLAGISGSIWAGSPNWVSILLAVLTGVTVTVYLSAYVFLLLKDRDALRSERFTLSKLAIEKGLIGDNLTGLFEEAEIGSGAMIESQEPTDDEEGEK